MKTATLAARENARGPLMTLVCGAAVALAVFATAFSSLAGATAPTPPTPIVKVTIDGNFGDLDDLENDAEMFLLSSIVAEHQARAGGAPLDMEALERDLGLEFESVVALDDRLIYKLVIINGEIHIICLEEGEIVVTDPLLADPVSVSQTTTVRID